MHQSRNTTPNTEESLCFRNSSARIILAGLAHKDPWSVDDFKLFLGCASLTNQYISATPEVVEIGGLRKTMDKLLAASKDGIERGRSCYIDVARNAIVPSKTYVGLRDRVAIGYELPPGHGSCLADLFPCMMMHTHMPGLGERSELMCHLSPEDILTFVGIAHDQVTFMISPMVTLMAMKTTLTRSP